MKKPPLYLSLLLLGAVAFLVFDAPRRPGSLVPLVARAIELPPLDQRTALRTVDRSKREKAAKALARKKRPVKADTSSDLDPRREPHVFSGPAQFRSLVGRCFNYTAFGSGYRASSYNYTLCAFSNVTQHEIKKSKYASPGFRGLLGVWDRWVRGWEGSELSGAELAAERLRQRLERRQRMYAAATAATEEKESKEGSRPFELPPSHARAWEDAQAESEEEHAVWLFSDGAACPGEKYRSVAVRVLCSLDGTYELSGAREPRTCEYELTFRCPQACPPPMNTRCTRLGRSNATAAAEARVARDWEMKRRRRKKKKKKKSERRGGKEGGKEREEGKAEEKEEQDEEEKEEEEEEEAETEPPLPSPASIAVAEVLADLPAKHHSWRTFPLARVLTRLANGTEEAGALARGELAVEGEAREDDAQDQVAEEESGKEDGDDHDHDQDHDHDGGGDGDACVCAVAARSAEPSAALETAARDGKHRTCPNLAARKPLGTEPGADGDDVRWLELWRRTNLALEEAENVVAKMLIDELPTGAAAASDVDGNDKGTAGSTLGVGSNRDGSLEKREEACSRKCATLRRGTVDRNLKKSRDGLLVLEDLALAMEAAAARAKALREESLAAGRRRSFE